jgi:hypothetical protein
VSLLLNFFLLQDQNSKTKQRDENSRFPVPLCFRFPSSSLLEQRIAQKKMDKKERNPCEGKTLLEIAEGDSQHSNMAAAKRDYAADLFGIMVDQVACALHSRGAIPSPISVRESPSLALESVKQQFAE